MFYMCYNAQYSIAAGSRTFDTKPVSVAECGYEVSYNTSIHSIFMYADKPIEQEYPDSELEKMETSIYHISYMYFTLFGMSVTCVAGTGVSLLAKLCGRDRDQPIDPKLLAPCIRKKQSRDIPLTTRSAPSNLKWPKMVEMD